METAYILKWKEAGVPLEKVLNNKDLIDGKVSALDLGASQTKIDEVKQRVKAAGQEPLSDVIKEFKEDMKVAKDENVLVNSEEVSTISEETVPAVVAPPPTSPTPPAPTVDTTSVVPPVETITETANTSTPIIEIPPVAPVVVPEVVVPASSSTPIAEILTTETSKPPIIVE